MTRQIYAIIPIIFVYSTKMDEFGPNRFRLFGKTKPNETGIALAWRLNRLS
jgi:hypothetical protein